MKMRKNGLNPISIPSSSEPQNDLGKRQKKDMKKQFNDVLTAWTPWNHWDDHLAHLSPRHDDENHHLNMFLLFEMESIMTNDPNTLCGDSHLLTKVLIHQEWVFSCLHVDFLFCFLCDWHPSSHFWLWQNLTCLFEVFDNSCYSVWGCSQLSLNCIIWQSHFVFLNDKSVGTIFNCFLLFRCLFLVLFINYFYNIFIIF